MDHHHGCHFPGFISARSISGKFYGKYFSTVNYNLVATLLSCAKLYSKRANVVGVGYLTLKELFTSNQYFLELARSTKQSLQPYNIYL